MRKLIFLFLLSSCASKQRLVQQQQRTEKFEMQQLTLLSEKKNQDLAYWYNDSTALSEQVLIYPEGAIQFGPEGFVGNAKAVVLLRQQNQRRQAIGNHTLTEQRLERQQVKEQTEIKQTEKVVQSNSWRWAGLGSLAVILVLLALGYTYWRRR